MSGKTLFMILALLSITFAGCSVKEAVNVEQQPNPSPAEQPYSSPEEQSYSSLLARVKNFDRSVDFKALRLAYTGTPDYSPYENYSEERQLMYEAFKNKRYETALKHAQSLLDKSYVDINAHFVCITAYREMNNPEKSDFHHFVGKGLLDSVLNSGDGWSPKTAYFVISLEEENVILSVFGFRKTGQSLIPANYHLYDKIDAINRETGETSVFYFEVDLLFHWLKKRSKK